jgi:hypothetical protein
MEVGIAHHAPLVPRHERPRRVARRAGRVLQVHEGAGGGHGQGAARLARTKADLGGLRRGGGVVGREWGWCGGGGGGVVVMGMGREWG